MNIFIMIHVFINLLNAGANNVTDWRNGGIVGGAENSAGRKATEV